MSQELNNARGFEWFNAIGKAGETAHRAFADGNGRTAIGDRADNKLFRTKGFSVIVGNLEISDSMTDKGQLIDGIKQLGAIGPNPTSAEVRDMVQMAKPLWPTISVALAPDPTSPEIRDMVKKAKPL